MSSVAFGLLKSAFAYSYGLFIMIVYAAIAILRGTFFSKTTEKEVLELQLGMHIPWISTILQVHPSDSPCNSS